MKNAILLTISAFFASIGYSQQWGGSTNLNNNISRNGSVQIGPNNSNRITIGPAPDAGPMWGRSYVGFNLKRGDSGGYTFLSDGIENDGVVIYSTKNSLNFSIKKSTGGSTGSQTQTDIADNTFFRLNRDGSYGKVHIGSIAGTSPTFTTFPGDFCLYVQNGILTEKVKVALHGTSQWSDYVFDDNYKLATINEVDEFIKENKHLPGVPSAKEVVQNGLDLAEMDATLLKKIEELTLYIIEQQKQIDELKEKIK